MDTKKLEELSERIPDIIEMPESVRNSLKDLLGHLPEGIVLLMTALDGNVWDRECSATLETMVRAIDLIRNSVAIYGILGAIHG